MDPFAGTARCPTCDKVVYAAEQVMGPGRRIYHKPCLKCVTCSRRLDSLSLLEHNREPYCKSCHVKNFGTRDLRSANLTESTPPRSPKRSATRISQSPPPMTSADSFRSDSSIPEEQSGKGTAVAEDTQESTDHDASAESSTTSQAASSEFPQTTRTDSPIPGNGLAQNPTKTPWTPPSYTARSLSPTATGSSTASAPAYLRQTMTGSSTDASPRPLRQNFTGNVAAARKAFGPSPGFAGTPNCPRCGKAVYFAEQVKASGRTWHKPCLRCTECSVLLDSTRITEKDGVVMCRSCYSKLHGPQGSGYALLGRAG